MTTTPNHATGKDFCAECDCQSAAGPGHHMVYGSLAFGSSDVGVMTCAFCPHMSPPVPEEQRWRPSAATSAPSAPELAGAVQNVWSWPVVLADDFGIRPAGPSDACLYCNMKVGFPHGRDCVTVEKKVRVKMIFEVDMKVPHAWTSEQISFRYNLGSWCADNAVDVLENLKASTNEEGPYRPCLCSAFTLEVVGVSDSRPNRADGSST